MSQERSLLVSMLDVFGDLPIVSIRITVKMGLSMSPLDPMYIALQLDLLALIQSRVAQNGGPNLGNMLRIEIANLLDQLCQLLV